MQNPLQDHPLLRGQTPGTTGYTQALRDLLLTLEGGEAIYNYFAGYFASG